jgi:hypothetical protein
MIVFRQESSDTLGEPAVLGEPHLVKRGFLAPLIDSLWANLDSLWADADVRVDQA